jgi:SPP1 gp7 family putative phage head morphogenesis protein
MSTNIRKRLLSLNKADNTIDELIDWEDIESQGIQKLNPAFFKVYTAGKKAAYETVGMAVSFNVLEPAAVKAAHKLTAKLVKEISEETRKAIRQHVARGIQDGLSNQEIARELKDFVGLTARQTKAISSYRDALLDKFPDLSEKELRSKMIQYKTVSYNRRMTTIARTETARAQTVGYVEGLNILDIDKFEFSTYPGHCEICHPLEGNIFTGDRAREVIPVHPNCRCVLLPVIPTSKGGPGSGNFGHEGRPGEVGGSGPSGGTVDISSLSETEIDAVDTYLRDSGFVNVALRGYSRYEGLSPEQKKVVDTMDQLIQRGPTTTEEMTVYRAIQRESFSEEESYIDRGFVSTSLERSIVESPGFVHPEDRVILDITIPKGTHYLRMEEVAAAIGNTKAEDLAASEKELVFGRNHEFNILEVSSNGRKAKVSMLKNKRASYEN